MRGSRKIFRFALLSILNLALLATACSEKPDPAKSGPPKAQVSASLTPAGAMVRVTVPPGHHAYLDRGDEGNLIPVTINWDEAVEKGLLRLAPALKEKPTGVRDETFKSTVLRGEGIFLYDVKSSETLRNQSISVKTQICDESRGICYRPVTEAVLLN